MMQTTPMPDQTEQTTNQTRPGRPADRTRPDRWHNHLALVPWSAGLLSAGYYQSDLAHQTFGWSYPWALAFPLAIEAGVAWSAGNFHRRLVQRDSAIGARVWLISLMVFSCSLLFFHADRSGVAVEGAAAISAMTVISAGVWLQRASSRRRDIMRQRGLIYPATPNYPAYRWLLCPLETWAAFRHGIKYGIEDPLAALDALRQTRPKQTTKPDRKNQTGPVSDSQTSRLPDPKPDQTRQTPEIPDRTSPVSPIHIPDGPYIDAITRLTSWPQTSLGDIQSLVASLDGPTGKCGRSRAIRLRAKALEVAA